MKTRMFLTNLRGTYHSLTLQFAEIVGTYCPMRDGVTRCVEPLPHHLTVLELVRTLLDKVAARRSAYALLTDTPLHSIHAHHTTT